ncbi:MAG: transposase [Gaiellaceae bacterium]
MGRIGRASLPDGFFHVVARGVFGAAIYADDHDRRWFLDLLRRCESNHSWTCHAFCLMTTHYHLVLETTRVQLSHGLHWLNTCHATTFNRRHGRFGHLFAERFSASAIESEDYLYDVCSYVLLNPVKARLCDRAEDWPWSFSRFGIEPS